MINKGKLPRTQNKSLRHGKYEWEIKQHGWQSDEVQQIDFQERRDRERDRGNIKREQWIRIT